MSVHEYEIIETSPCPGVVVGELVEVSEEGGE